MRPSVQPGQTLAAIEHRGRHDDSEAHIYDQAAHSGGGGGLPLPDAILYVRSDGDDANDGLSWRYPKKTVLNAYDTLPAGGGTVYVYGTVAWGSEVSGQGIWLAGYQDSQYSNLPAGWRQAKHIAIIGVGPYVSSFNVAPQAYITGGSATDPTKPAVWITGTNTIVWFENLIFQYPAVAMRIGVDTGTGSRNTNTAGIRMVNVTANLNQGLGSGPVFDMGSVWGVEFTDLTAGSNSAAYTLTAASIQSGTTARFTTSVTHRLVVGDTVDIRNVTPAEYNTAPPETPWKITAVGSNWFEADIGSSPSSATAFGTARPVDSVMRAIFSCPTNATFNVNGGMWSGAGILMGQADTYYSTIKVTNLLKEGNWGQWYDPPLFAVRTSLGGGAQIWIEDCGSADSLLDGEVTVPPGDYTRRVTVVNSPISVKGDVTIIGGHTTRSDGPPAMGAWAGHLYGQHEAYRRNFAPTIVRHQNLAPQDTSTWSGKPSFGTPTLTTGKVAPDGTTTAVELSAVGQADGYHGKTLLYQAQTLAVGDRLIYGFWMRMVAGPTFAAQFGGGSTNSNNVMDVQGNNTIWQSPLSQGGQEWQWVVATGKFIAVGTPDSTINLQIVLNNANYYDDPVCEYWGPVICHIPAGVMSDAEASEYTKHMGTIAEGVAGGGVNLSMMSGHRLVFAPDTNLYRSAANVLSTGDNFTAALDIIAQYGGTYQTKMGAQGPGAESGLSFGTANDTNLYRAAANQLKSDDTIIGADGVATKTKAGTPTDGDFVTTPPDGTIVVDTTANKIWVRVGGTWKYSTLT